MDEIKRKHKDITGRDDWSTFTGKDVVGMFILADGNLNTLQAIVDMVLEARAAATPGDDGDETADQKDRKELER